MTRQQQLDAQRERGLPTLAVLPIHYPRELLEALDILGLELWGPPGPLPDGPSERIQTYVCSLVRNAMAFVDAGGVDGVDGLLFPTTCDAMMGLASLVPDLAGWEGRIFHLHLPRTADAEVGTRFCTAEVERLGAELATAFDRPLDDDRLTAAIATRRRIEAAHAELRHHRRELPLGERELMELLRADGWQRADDHLAELERALARRGEGARREGPGVLISGIVPEPMAVLDVLDQAGAVVVADDYASSGRRLTQLAPDFEGSPRELIGRRLAHRPPCSTLGVHMRPRADHLVRLARGTGAAGVILHIVRFCEPELFDVPALADRMEEEGIPLLVIDTEVERELPGPVRTRLEAFVEMLT
jgi:benzoyl-CoA reductase/2-hydroxyglutaryl-CoA dehydratase subunit BcrC/BadD/HgdB